MSKNSMSPEAKFALICILLYWAALMCLWFFMEVLDVDDSQKPRVEPLCFDDFGLWKFTVGDEHGTTRMTPEEFARYCVGGAE
jgi:hypothetical protein